MRARSASRITSAGPWMGLEKLCLRRVRSSVPPAEALYSPPERVVGMLIMGMVGALMMVGRMWGGAELDRLAREEEVCTLLARA